MGTSRLGDALFNGTRQAVLGLLFGHIDKRFYQRQIIQELGLGSGAVQRELQQLTQADILNRTLEGRQTYFQANRHCVVFDELRSLVRKTFGIADVLKGSLQPLERRIRIAFVFGSIVTGAETDSSDIDLMIIGPVSLTDVVSASRTAQRELGREINPTLYSEAEFYRKLAAGQHFVTQVAAGPKMFLIGDEQCLKRLAETRLAQTAQDQPAGDRRSSRSRRPRPDRV